MQLQLRTGQTARRTVAGTARRGLGAAGAGVLGAARHLSWGASIAAACVAAEPLCRVAAVPVRPVAAVLRAAAKRPRSCMQSVMTVTTPFRCGAHAQHDKVQVADMLLQRHTM